MTWIETDRGWWHYYDQVGVCIASVKRETVGWCARTWGWLPKTEEVYGTRRRAMLYVEKMVNHEEG